MIFHIVISSFQPLYLACNEIRRNQFKQYGISYLICFNGKKPDDYVLREDERLLEEEGMNPHMFIKFKNALREIFDKGMEPDYIIRTNATTFVNYKKLLWVLSYLPKEKCCAGPLMHKNNDQVFCNGTCIILSRDVALRLAYDNNSTNPIIMNENDDYAISIIARNYSQLIDINYFYWWVPSITNSFTMDNLITKQNHVFLRIQNEFERGTVDILLWNFFHHAIDILNIL